MSDTSQGEGWWQASDGKWYPPEQHPGATSATPPTAAQPTAAQPAAAPGWDQPAAGQPAAAPGWDQPVGGDAPGETDGKPPKGKGKLIAILVVVLLLIGAGVAAFLLLGGDDEDEGDLDITSTTAEPDIGDATGELTDDGPIEFNTEYDDALEEDRTEARYALDAPDGAIMTVTVANDEASNRPVRMNFESAGEQFASFRVQPGATESEVVILDDAGGAEFDLIFTEGPAAYTFEVGLETQDDAGSGGDAGAEFADAVAIEAGQDVAGLLGGQDQTDHYTVEVQPGTEFTMAAANDRSSERPARFTVQLDGEQLFAERIQPGADASVSLLLGADDEGTIDVVVTEGPADYTFTADFVEQNEGGEGDAPSELADARTIDISSAIEGKVGGRDDGDYYLFTAPSASFQLTASSEASSERPFRVTVEDASGGRLASFRVQPGAEATEAVEVEAGSEVRLVVQEGPAKYSISVG